MPPRILTALPVFNERAFVEGALAGALNYCREVLVVDDGSTDGTGELLTARDDIHLIRHPHNRGYGAALMSAFDFAVRQQYDVLVTIDCDGQHQPQLIPHFIELAKTADLVSGSRYLRSFPGDIAPPEERRKINLAITEELNRLLDLRLTDSFCGFKAYKTSSLAQFRLTETGYAMPLELWVQAKFLGLQIVETPVPLVYLDLSRSFGGAMDQADMRLEIYRQIIAKSIATCKEPMGNPK
jgi:glycosyltransferase involved in cell wall biosynthesis